LADTDALTGLPNRRAGLSRLRTCFNDARNQGTPLSVAYVDIDLFKQINDTYGHETGDRVLTLVGNALASSVRQRDDVIRIGGEEFLVLLPGVSGNTAAMRMETMRARIADTTPLLDVDGLQVTASIGLASLADADEDVDVLLRRADQAMYRAKNQGRNRVIGDGQE